MWNLKVIDTSRSLYIAVADALERDIRSGELRAGDKLPTHRELAKKVGVTVTTATRAYAEAEKRGLITAVVGKGTFVSADACINATVLDTKLAKAPMDMGLVRPLFHCEEGLVAVTENILRDKDLIRYMQYSDPQGMPEHREVGAEWIGRFGVATSPDSVVVTAGGQHAVFCVFYSLFEAGDRIAVESLTYPGAKAAARRLGLRLEGVPIDNEGFIPEELEALCKRHTIKGIYAVGRMQNPTNRRISAPRREALAAIIRKYDITLIENDAYAFLCPRKNQTLSNLLPQNSVYISTISKAFYAGLRVAFVAAPPRFCTKIAQGVVDSVLLASPLNTAIACACIRNGQADALIQNKKSELRRRITVFRRKLKGYSFECPDDCMSAWLRLPEGWTSASFEEESDKYGLRVYGAEKFAVGSAASPDYVRISLSGPEDMPTFEKSLTTLKSILAVGPG